MNVGIIGCGGIAVRRHLPVCASYEGVTLYAVCDPVRENADRAAQQYGGKAYYDPEAFFACRELDAVIVCTPERFHKDNVISALRAGKHVLCEKPMSMTQDEALEMYRVWKETDRMLMIAFNMRISKVHVLTKQLLKDGAIGKPIAYRTNLAHAGSESAMISGAAPDFYDRHLRNMGGVMLNVGSHRVDLMDYLFDSPIREVFAETPAIDKKYADGRLIDAEDHAFVIARHENGLEGTLWISWCNYGPMERQTVIYGTEGVLKTYEGKGIVVCKKDGTREEYDTSTEHDEFLDITVNYLDALCGKGTIAADGADGLRCMSALDAILRSGRERRWIEVPELG